MNAVEIVLSKLRDVVSLNAFIAFRPERARLVYKTSKSAGLWQLDLVDLANEKNLWTVGHYVDGLEDRLVEYDVAVKRRWRGYVDLVHANDDCLRYVVRLQSGYVFVTLPNEHKEEIVITVPQICGRHVDPLQEPVYIWRDASGQYYVLSCAHRPYEFKAFSDLENWIRTKKSMEDDNKKLRVLWREWYVIPGKISGEEEWSAAVRKAKMGDYKPDPDEAIEIIRRLT